MMGVTLTAGGSLGWFQDELCKLAGGKTVSFEKLTAEAEKTPTGAEGLQFLPYLSGERTPHLDPNARGARVGDLLFKELKSQAAQKGWPLVRWITADNNYRARGLYDQLSSKTHWVTYQLDVG